VAIQQRPSAYHHLSFAEKERASMERDREPSIACPADCGTHVQPSELLMHMDQRCAGPREPGPAAIWVDRQAAVSSGVPPETLQYWARTGKVRTRGDRMDRKYLLRDLARRVGLRKLDRRR
jgi:hypothetical protein